MLQHLRPGDWEFSVRGDVAVYDEYEHLADLAGTLAQRPGLWAMLGDYVAMPDILVGRRPVSDHEINRSARIVEGDTARLTPLRAANAVRPKLILHAMISCKLTLQSDSDLHLIRSRKGSLPHVLAVTAEPLPMRIAALALGTGDLDCVYHFALPELHEAVVETESEDQLEMLQVLLNGRRLRDISDLPFDLAI